MKIVPLFVLGALLAGSLPAAAQPIRMHTDSQNINCYTNAPTSLPTQYRRPRVTVRKSAVVLTPLEVLSYTESAYQQLPARYATVSTLDPVTQQPVQATLPISQLITHHARMHDIDPLVIDILMGHESAYRVDAASSAGARGLMQLMPETAASLGVTNIEDPAQNIAAGVRYLAEQVRRFGDLNLALAAYNAGPGAVASYGGIPPYAETIHYVSSIGEEYRRRRKRA